MIVRMYNAANVCRIEEADNWQERENEARSFIRTMKTPMRAVVYPCPAELATKAHFARDSDQWITVSEAHRLAGVTHDEIYRAINSGHLTARLDEGSTGGEERHRVRRSRVLERWPRATISDLHARIHTARKLADYSRDPDQKERFWEKVEKRGSQECWYWQGGRTGRGYGTYWARGMARAAHKVAYELSKGAVPKGKYVRHTCDNVLCVNPAHLTLSDKKC